MMIVIKQFNELPLLLLISLSAIAYLIIIFLTGVVDKVDIQMARQLMGGVKMHGIKKGK
jgi:hypothetical protein